MVRSIPLRPFFFDSPTTLTGQKMEEGLVFINPNVLTVSSPSLSSERESDSIQVQGIQNTQLREEKKKCR